jgi:hypothetical protein
MPSKTPAQQRFMRMCHALESREAKKYKCPPKKVAEEFYQADKKKSKK